MKRLFAAFFFLVLATKASAETTLVDYTPSGGPIAAAATPGFSQLATYGLEDDAGSQVYVNGFNQLQFTGTSSVTNILSDAPSTGASSVTDSSFVVYFELDSNTGINIFLRSSVAALSNSTNRYAYVASLGGATRSATTLGVGWNNNVTALTTLNTSSSFTTYQGLMYAMKADIVGSPATITVKLWNVICGVSQVGPTESYTDTASSIKMGTSGLQEYKNNTVPFAPITHIQVFTGGAASDSVITALPCLPKNKTILTRRPFGSPF